MKRMILWAALAALALGMPATGCFLASDDSIGRFCAAPASGEEYCVDADHDPAAAWDQAEARGAKPIQMWATWPSSVTLDELVESPERLKIWSADNERVTAYVRDEQRHAESYQASLDGHQRALLKEATVRQAELLGELIAQKPVDTIGRFKQAMTDNANAEKDPLVATIATDKQAMIAVQAVLDQASNDVAPLQARLADVVARFTDYRATEAAETAAYVTLSARASASGLDTIGEVEQAILAEAHGASGRPNDLAAAIMTLSAELQTFAGAYGAAIAPHADYLATHGAALPDMTSGALRSLNAMLGYVQRRVARSDATATALLNGIAMRRQALAMLQEDRATREAVARAQLLRASATFRDSARARVDALAKAPPASARLGLPYLAARMGQLTAVLQLRPLCEASTTSWREDGCASLREQFSGARTYLETTLPREIRTGLAAMRARGVDPRLLDAAQAKLDAGDVKGAALAYDTAVRSAEGT